MFKTGESMRIKGTIREGVLNRLLAAIVGLLAKQGDN